MGDDNTPVPAEGQDAAPPTSSDSDSQPVQSEPLRGTGKGLGDGAGETLRTVLGVEGTESERLRTIRESDQGPGRDFSD